MPGGVHTQQASQTLHIGKPYGQTNELKLECPAARKLGCSAVSLRAGRQLHKHDRRIRACTRMADEPAQTLDDAVHTGFSLRRDTTSSAHRNRRLPKENSPPRRVNSAHLHGTQSPMSGRRSSGDRPMSGGCLPKVRASSGARILLVSLRGSAQLHSGPKLSCNFVKLGKVETL